MCQYNIPGDIDELFANGNRNYSIIDYSIEGMDSEESMDFFLDFIGVPQKNIVLDDGTQVYLVHEDYDYELKIDAGGLGDFFSHSFEVTICKPEEQEQ